MDLGYITACATVIRNELLFRGRACELAYTPGNSTCYPLVFQPVGADTADLIAVSDWTDDPRGRSVFKHEHRHVQEQDGWVLVSWLGHGAWIFRLSGETPDPPHWPYVMEKLGGSRDDATALALLFSAIAIGAARDLRAVS